MEFQCVCGKTLSAEVAPGTVVQCPSCGQQIRVPEAAGASAGPSAVFGPRPPAPTRTAGTSGMAVTALVLGCVSVLFGFLTGIPALILGVVAILKVNRSQGRLAGTGHAIAGLVLGGVFSLLWAALLVAVMLPALARARDVVHHTRCSSNLRMFGIAITDYAIEQDDKMAPGDLNTFSYLATYLGENPHEAGGSEVFRCPVHPWLPDAQRYLYASYAFNISLDAKSNDLNCPFSLKSSDTLRRLGGTSPDTILVIEMWMRRGPDGTFPNQLRLDQPDWSPIKAGVAPIDSYSATTSATFDARGRLVDPGPYRFLDCYKDTTVPVGQMYHFGKINVLFADGSVQPLDIRQLTSVSPSEDRRWTRMRD